MVEALLWGSSVGLSNMLGAVVIMLVSLPKRLIGAVMALGTGALISAVAYELLDEALKLSGLTEIALGFFGGAIIFTIFDFIVNRKGGQHRKRSGHESDSPDGSGSGIAIFIGTIMDSLPEAAIVGLSLISGGVNVALVIAVAISNVSEGVSSTSGLLKGGFSKKKVLIMWLAVIIATALSSLAGYIFLENASDSANAILRSFAAGALIAMIASTMMPEAYQKGGPLVGFITAAGIFITLLL